jgi:hypothetical protein
MVTLARVNNTTLHRQECSIEQMGDGADMIQMWCPKQILLVTDF